MSKKSPRQFFKHKRVRYGEEPYVPMAGLMEIQLLKLTSWNSDGKKYFEELLNPVNNSHDYKQRDPYVVEPEILKNEVERVEDQYLLTGRGLSL